MLTAAIERIVVLDVARCVAAEWDTAPGLDPPRFAPPWRPSESGTSLYADADKWVDLGEGKGAGRALDLVARARWIIGNSHDSPRGEDNWRAVNALREEGYDIPYFSGRDDLHCDGLRLYEEPEDDDETWRQLFRAARADGHRDGG